MSENIPELRFKYFNKGWEPRKLGDLLTEIKRPIKMQDELQYQLVTVKRRNNGIVSRGYFKGKEVLVKNYFELKTGDYLISKRQVVHGANGIVPDNLDGAVVSNEYLVSTGNNNITTDFLTILSKLPQMYKMFFLSSYGIDIEKLVFNVEDWKKRKVNIPLLAEQKKISVFFNVLDKNIDLQQHALNLLKQRKKAFLQKMFPKKGTKNPELRFAGFRNDWVKQKFGEIVDIQRGLTYKPSDVSNMGIRVLRSSNINEDTFKVFDNDIYVNEDAVNKPLVNNGDILVTAANGSTRLVGKHAVIENLNSKAVHGGFMLLIRAKNNYFINAWMSSTAYSGILNLVQGGNGAIGNLSKSMLDNSFISLPSEEEQLLIGNFFKELDNSITLQEEKLESLKQMKKAFLQKMFV